MTSRSAQVLQAPVWLAVLLMLALGCTPSSAPHDASPDEIIAVVDQVDRENAKWGILSGPSLDEEYKVGVPLSGPYMALALDALNEMEVDAEVREAVARVRRTSEARADAIIAWATGRRVIITRYNGLATSAWTAHIRDARTGESLEEHLVRAGLLYGEDVRPSSNTDKQMLSGRRGALWLDTFHARIDAAEQSARSKRLGLWAE